MRLAECNCRDPMHHNVGCPMYADLERQLAEARAELREMKLEREARNKIDPTTRLHNLCDGLAEHRRESPYDEESWRLADEDNARLRAEVARLKAWLDSNTTFYDVDADFDVEGHNIPVLAQVSKRIWYHATDDIASYPFSAVIARAERATEEPKG